MISNKNVFHAKSAPLPSSTGGDGSGISSGSSPAFLVSNLSSTTSLQQVKQEPIEEDEEMGQVSKVKSQSLVKESVTTISLDAQPPNFGAFSTSPPPSVAPFLSTFDTSQEAMLTELIASYHKWINSDGGKFKQVVVKYFGKTADPSLTSRDNLCLPFVMRSKRSPQDVRCTDNSLEVRVFPFTVDVKNIKSTMNFSDGACRLTLKQGDVIRWETIGSHFTALSKKYCSPSTPALLFLVSFYAEGIHQLSVKTCWSTINKIPIKAGKYFSQLQMSDIFKDQQSMSPIIDLEMLSINKRKAESEAVAPRRKFTQPVTHQVATPLSLPSLAPAASYNMSREFKLMPVIFRDMTGDVKLQLKPVPYYQLPSLTFESSVIKVSSKSIMWMFRKKPQLDFTPVLGEYGNYYIRLTLDNPHQSVSLVIHTAEDILLLEEDRAVKSSILRLPRAKAPFIGAVFTENSTGDCVAYFELVDEPSSIRQPIVTSTVISINHSSTTQL